jgi:hypothetical protein
VEPLEQLAYETALRALDQQETLLAEVRARTATLMAASSVAASFLGRGALAGRGWVAACGVVAFAVSIAAGLYVLAPRESLAFSVSGTVLYERLYDIRRNPEEIRRRLVYELGRLWYENDLALARLVRALRLCAFALAFEIAFLLTSTSGTIF